MILVFCRLMKAQTLGNTSSLEFMKGRRVFEINPEHPIIKDLNVKLLLSKLSHPDDPEAQKAVDLLYDTALISSGFTDIDDGDAATAPPPHRTSLRSSEAYKQQPKKDESEALSRV
ncbi:hypothetical protein B296_00048249 [Ensete ventricosum]|uniref:Endoplasmin n=1 Tax=Ensete ventricosum TaxID=4639 RepID=A0A426YVH4_ENSVE|nr:hypothetical protein B296_00048249 [Ensete ventricosum]